ncbi:DUF6895 family protein [Alloyangia pacifica]|uniref:DUF6895 family protein n=1 Tax=Alloyangia pacifica TaxID=311180 RepID=UPI001CFE5C2F|nr:hypothetical protein [Alloyangia pacifica]
MFKGGLRKSETWIEENLAHFQIGKGSDNIKIIKLKPLSELLLALYICRSKVNPKVLHRIASWAWGECEQGDLLFRILMAKPDIYRLATTLYLFKQLGFENYRLSKLLEEISRMQIFGAVEGEAWINIATDFAVSRLLCREENLELYDNSFLFKKPEPWVLSEQSVYAVTHEVFYATDFGARDAVLTPDVKEYLVNWAPVWCQIYSEEANYDLVGELCIVLRCIGQVSMGRHWANSILVVQQENGAVEGPEDAGQQFMLAIDADAAERAFYKNYHTTLVSMCMFAMYSD